MFYLVFVILTVLLFLYLRKDRRLSDRYMALMMTALVLVLLFSMFYISRDPYYYNVLNQYFPLPMAVWRFIMKLGVPKGISLRGLNLSAALFLFSCGGYALHYRISGHERVRRRIFRALIVWIVFITAAADPGIYAAVYLRVCENPLTPETIARASAGATKLTRAVNIAVVLLCVLHVFVQAGKNAGRDFFRRYTLGESVCFAGIAVSYLVVFWFAPSNLVSVSKLAGLVTYKSLPLLDIPLLYQIFPVFLIVMGVINIFFTIHYVQMQNKLAQNRLEITCRIDAANTTSKAFCHYMKNELLALQSEIDLLEVSGEQSAQKQEILGRFEHLYQRLDEVHRSTSMSRLTLKKNDLRALVDELLDRLSLTLAGITVRREYTGQEILVLCDSAYFEQAIHNIILNAVDAMNKKGGREKLLVITLAAQDDGALLMIRDNGVGIAKENLDRIFSPFYSSEPVRQHWGMGLTVTYRIIQAHRGTIAVDSERGEGAVFTICLPLLS